MARSIPNINTSRLTLRAMRLEDFDRFAEIWATDAAWQHAAGGPWSRPRAWEAFLRNAGHWQMAGFGEWAIEARGERRMIGQVGFRFAGTEFGADFDAYPEVSMLLDPAVQHRGIGTEAIIAAHDWFDRIITGPAVARIFEDDAPSFALAERLGYATVRTINIDDRSIFLMRRDAPPEG
ncbi:MAG: GNAT family N-acetyltransferase [Marinibacterium sp.]